MSDTGFAIFAIIVLPLFVGVALGLLLWPSKFLRHLQNRLQPDTPWNRVQMRGLGFMLCLLMLMVITRLVKSLQGFHRNILLALWASPIVIAIFLWILWRYTPIQHINRRFLAGESDEPGWELRMNLAFSSLLAVIVVGAFLLAETAIYPK